MENLSPATSTTITPITDLTKTYNIFTHKPRTLFDLIDQFQTQENFDNDDSIIALKALHMTDTGNIQIPGNGEYALTEWSKKQLATLVGVKWDKWFETAYPVEQAEEINRRFNRYDQQIKLRTLRWKEPGVEASGILKAFVSPGYTAVKDSQVAMMMLASMRPIESEFRIIRCDVTDKSVSYVIGVGHPYKVGGPGEVGDVWGGIIVRNSGVGFASLMITLHMTRLVCRNGMTAPLKNAELLRHRHTKGIADDKLFGILGERLLEVPGKLRHCGQVLQMAALRPVVEPLTEVARVLENAKLPKRMIEPVMAAFAIEPRPHAFGISSALTRAAQGFAPEERLLLEQAASTYLMNQN